MGGTADFIGFSRSNRTLQVIDYKHGSLRHFVSPTNNPQLKIYALAAALTIEEPVSTIRHVDRAAAHPADTIIPAAFGPQTPARGTTQCLAFRAQAYQAILHTLANDR